MRYLAGTETISQPRWSAPSRVRVVVCAASRLRPDGSHESLASAGGIRSLGVLAVPIIITQLAQMGMGVADAIMAGRVSATDLAGIALGGNLYWPLMLLISGIVMAVTPTVSHGTNVSGERQRPGAVVPWATSGAGPQAKPKAAAVGHSQLHGAGRVGDAGAIVRQALWIAVCGGAMVAVLLQNVEPAYRLLGVDERAIPVAAGYLRAASLGLPAMLAYVALRCLCEGMSWTRPAMCIGHGDRHGLGQHGRHEQSQRGSPGRGTPMEADGRSRLSPTPSMERIHQSASAM